MRPSSSRTAAQQRGLLPLLALLIAAVVLHCVIVGLAQSKVPDDGGPAVGLSLNLRSTAGVAEPTPPELAPLSSPPASHAALWCLAVIGVLAGLVIRTLAQRMALVRGLHGPPPRVPWSGPAFTDPLPTRLSQLSVLRT